MEGLNNGRVPFYFDYDLMNMGQIDIDWNTFEYTYNGLLPEAFGDADVNWNKEVYKQMALSQQANFSYFGGNENTNYSFSLGAMDQEGMTPNEGFKQYNIRISMDTELSKSIKVGSSLNFGHTDSQYGDSSSLTFVGFNEAFINARPDFPVRDENGQLTSLPDYQYGFPTFEPNPLVKMQNKGRGLSYNFIGNSYIEITPIERLKLRSSFSTAIFNSSNSLFIPGKTMTDFGVPNDSYLDESDGRSTNLTSSLTADYTFNWADHKFSLLAGTSWERSRMANKYHFYVGFPDDEILVNSGSSERISSYGNNRSESGINSLFSRLGYNYQNKYMATLSFRSDKSSKFGPGNRRGYFPSLSVSWNAAEESFLKESKSINSLKLRASIGKVGSVNITNFAFLQFFNSTSSDIYAGNKGVIASNTLPNKHIQWEDTQEINFGIDFAMLNSRLFGNVDVYRRITTGALAPTPIPLELGPSNYISNLMDISNKGIEVSLGGTVVKSSNFKWDINANWALNRNILEKLNGANINQYNLDYYIEGKPVGTIKGYQVEKIIQTQEEADALNAASPTGVYSAASLGPGDYLFNDLNGDGRITIDDRTIIGSIEPDYFGGFSQTLTYKNIELSTYFQYSIGAESVWNAPLMGSYNSLGLNKTTHYGLNTWTPENPDAHYAIALYSDPSQNGRLSDRYVFESSYLRLKNIQLRYQLSKDLLKKYGLQAVSFSLNASNLITWTRWPGLDPEIYSERGTITDRARNEDPYPLAKTISLGLQVQF